MVLWMLIFFAAGCTKEGYVIANTTLFQDEKLTQKQSVQIHRGDYVKLKNCTKLSCRVVFSDQYEGYLPVKYLLDKKNIKIVTFVKNGELKKEPDLLAENIKTVEAGTRGFLITEQKRWSLVDLDTSRGWVLMEKLFQGESPFKLFITLSKLTLEFNGKWYIPFVSAERFFSLEKAFDLNPVSFAVVRKDDSIAVNVKNYESQQSTYVLKYDPPQTLKYKNLGLPEEIEIQAPASQLLNTGSGLQYEFQGNSLVFKITKAPKDLVYLNHFSITVKNEP